MTDIKYAVGEPGGIPRRKDMDKSRFTWKAIESFTRSKDGKGGVRLERDSTYDVAAFNPEVVAEWVRAGAAEWAGGKKAAKDKVE